MWEGAGDRTELKYFNPHCYRRQRCVFLVLLMLNRSPWGPLCWVLAFLTASYQQLFWTPNSIRVPEGPFGRVWLSLPHLVYNSAYNCLELQLELAWLLSYIIVHAHSIANSIFEIACLIVINCHAVHRSLSSGASVLSVPFHQPNPPTRSLSITGHWNVSIPSCASPWNGIFGRVKGQNTTQHRLWINRGTWDR